MKINSSHSFLGVQIFLGITIYFICKKYANFAFIYSASMLYFIFVTILLPVSFPPRSPSLSDSFITHRIHLGRDMGRLSRTASLISYVQVNSSLPDAFACLLLFHVRLIYVFVILEFHSLNAQGQFCDSLGRTKSNTRQ